MLLVSLSGFKVTLLFLHVLSLALLPSLSLFDQRSFAMRILVVDILDARSLLWGAARIHIHLFLQGNNFELMIVIIGRRKFFSV